MKQSLIPFLKVGNLLCFVVISGFFTGCETIPQKPKTEDAAAVVKNKGAVLLEKGMLVADIRAMLGEPRDIVPIDEVNFLGEAWFYTDNFEKYLGEVVVDLEHIPYTDPVTGEEREILDPIMGQEFLNIIQVTILYVQNDRLVGWKQKIEEERDYR